MAKPFKTYEELLLFLQDEKNLTIEDMDTARRILLKTSYFSLISGYKDTFKNRTTGLMTSTVYINLIMNCAAFS